MNESSNCTDTKPCTNLSKITGHRDQRGSGLFWLNVVNIDTGKATRDCVALRRSRAHGGPIRINHCPACGTDISRGFKAEEVNL